MDVHINYTSQMVLYSGCLNHPHISSKAMTLSGGVFTANHKFR